MSRATTFIKSNFDVFPPKIVNFDICVVKNKIMKMVTTLGRKTDHKYLKKQLKYSTSVRSLVKIVAYLGIFA